MVMETVWSTFQAEGQNVNAAPHESLKNLKFHELVKKKRVQLYEQFQSGLKPKSKVRSRGYYTKRPSLFPFNACVINFPTLNRVTCMGSRVESSRVLQQTRPSV